MSDWVTSSLEPFAWDNEESANYEAALDGINEVRSLLLNAERAEPDPTRREIWDRERREYVEWARTLDPTDHGEVARARRRCAVRAAELRERS